MIQADFDSAFCDLTGKGAFPWQKALFERFITGDFPEACILPTGLGKTSILAIWLLALAKTPDLVPRRLVYVVNRRTVVDQSTDEAVNLRKNLPKVPAVFNALKELVAVQTDSPLAISTLRGQFADNREWSSDPARPAIIAGTVDMIGSRLLFSGYGCGFKSRPMHAGFLGQDTLLVHDEAHLEPAFQELLLAMVQEQDRCKEFRKFRVMELTATSQSPGEVFELTPEEQTPPEWIPQPATEPIHHVWRRLKAKKALALHENRDEKKLADEIAELALKHKDSGQAVLVFVRKVDDVAKIVKKLPSGSVEILTGTLRGMERDQLIDRPIFRRFLRKAEPAGGTVYLVCTSAGEVGVNISADHLVCDLTPFDSMAQRFGRVNRFGDCADTHIDIVCPKEMDENDKYDLRRKRTLVLLRELNGDASPLSLGKLKAESRREAFSPRPTILPVSDILFDAWALTTVRDPLPGRPPVADWLHGVEEEVVPETLVAWREEVGVVCGDLLKDHPPEELLEAYPLKPHELLRDRADRVFKHLEVLARSDPSAPVWVVARDGSVEVTTLNQLADGDKDFLNGCTVVLPPAVGGLNRMGILATADPAAQLDVAHEWCDDQKKARRARTWEEEPPGMRLVLSITVPDSSDEEAEGRVWRWYVRPSSADDESGSWSSRFEQDLTGHLDAARKRAARLVEKLRLPEPLARAVTLAAQYHDLGKRRKLWQTSIGNRDYPAKVLAKSDHSRRPESLSGYRHEFGSVRDVVREASFQTLTPLEQDLVLHLIAAHHGRARPHFPVNEVFDPEGVESASRTAAAEIPSRFARLQRAYGRWGLAYLESLVRASDYLASEEPL